MVSSFSPITRPLRLARIFLAVTVAAVVLPVLGAQTAAAAGLSESEPNDTIGAATSLPFDQNITGSIKDGHDVDYYKLSTARAGKLKLDFTFPLTETGKGAYTITVLTGDNYQYAKYQIKTDHWDGKWLAKQALYVPSGTLYIKIEPHNVYPNVAGLKYQLTASLTPGNVELEPNGTIGSSTPVALNKTIEATIVDGHDVDYFRIRVPQSGPYSLDFTFPQMSGDEGAYSVTVLSSNNTNYAEFRRVSTSDSNGTRLAAEDLHLLKGDVYIKIEPYNVYTIVDGLPYELRLAPACSPYPDVTKANTHCDNIEWLKQQEITKPADGKYHPESYVNRGSMTAFLFRLVHPGAKAPICKTKPFPDVSTSNVFCGYIQWAKQNKIAFGYSNGNFGPTAEVTRGAMAAFLQRIASPGKPAAKCTQKPFNDVKISDTFCGVITWMVTNKITFGVGNNKYGTTQYVTRQSMASFLKRIADMN